MDSAELSSASRPQPSPVSDVLADSPQPPTQRNHTRRNLAVGSAALGAVSLGVAGFFALSASGSFDDAQSLCPNGSPCDDPVGVSLSEDAERSGNIATAFTGVSLAAFAAAGYFWFTRPTGEASSLRVTPSATSNGGAVFLKGTF